mgnify:CR=1 FL=1
MRGAKVVETQIVFQLHLVQQLVPRDHPLWFLVLSLNDVVWIPTVFTRNLGWLLDQGTVQEFVRSAILCRLFRSLYMSTVRIVKCVI